MCIRDSYHTRNLGMYGNSLATNTATRGEYIALLDGDDFWTSPEKLQRGVAALDGHPDCSGSYHFVSVVDAVGNVIGSHPAREQAPTRVTFADFLRSNNTPTGSVMFRRSCLPETIPPWANGLGMIDWPAFLSLTSHGDFLLIDATLGAHRQHHASVWSRRDGLHIARSMEEFHTRVCRQYPEATKDLRAEYRKGDAFLYIRAADAAGNAALGRKYFLRYFFSRPRLFRAPPGQRGAVVRAFMPWIRRWLPYNATSTH